MERHRVQGHRPPTPRLARQHTVWCVLALLNPFFRSQLRISEDVTLVIQILSMCHIEYAQRHTILPKTLNLLHFDGAEARANEECCRRGNEGRWKEADKFSCPHHFAPTRDTEAFSSLTNLQSHKIHKATITILMNNTKRDCFTSVPMALGGGEVRPQKRTKLGGTMEVVSVLADIGVSNYNRGNYQAAEECFSQALSSLHFGSMDIIISKPQTDNKLGMNKIGTTIKNEGMSCEAKHEDKPKELEEAPTNTEYDEGMRVYCDLMEIQETSPLDEVAAMMFYNVGQSLVQRRLEKDATAYFRKSLDRFLALDGCSNPLFTVMNLHSLGYCLYRTENWEQANDCYKRALSTVSTFNLGSRHLAASVNCVGVLLFNKKENQESNTEVALSLFLKSLALYNSCCGPSAGTDCNVSIATVLNNIGRTRYLRSEFEKAYECYVECLRLRREYLGQNSNDVAATAYNLGQVCYQLGRLDDALPHYEEFLAIKKTRSSSSNDIALVYKGIAEIYQEKSDFPMALSCYRKALEIQKSACCKQQRPGLDISSTLNKMGNLCYEMKDFKTAMTYYQEGLTIEKQHLEANHNHIIITTTNIGHIHKQLGEFRKALSTYKIVLKLQRSKLEAGNEMGLAEIHSSIGLMQYHLKDYSESFDSYQDALRIRRQYLEVKDDEHPLIASTLNSIGLVLFKQELFDLSKKCFQESLRIRTKLLGKNHKEVAILWYNIATIHFEKGEDELAIQMYKETLRVERHALGNDHSDVTLTLQHLGQVHQQLGYTEEAIGYFQEALDIVRRRHTESSSSSSSKRTLARILNLLGNTYLQLGKTSEMMECYNEAARIYQSNRQQLLGESLVIGGYNFFGLSKTNPPCAPVA